ncbi:hypothetical protein ACFRAU_11490 [Arthrobacter sp. NPDC056691]|uniref:hypothetical protein n=1 Tax=Arthrobacter sp. NPDC056691 TaxID=3345913 RepID=UPI0036708AE1
MPVTHNVAWDGRLESFKGRDTTLYVTTAAAVATTCDRCRRPLRPEEPLSLIVDIAESTAPDGTEYLTFSDWVCHRRCGDPTVTVHDSPNRPEGLAPLAARVILVDRSGTGPARTVPMLAYTLVPVVSFREAGGELTSALVAILLSHGFQLAMSGDYSDILNQARQTGNGCRFTLSRNGLLTLEVGGETIYREQLDPDSPDDAEWLQAAGNGSILVIGGDNLVVTGSSLDITAAAGLGTLVMGTVTVRSAG